MPTKEEIGRVNTSTLEKMKALFPQMSIPDLEKNIQVGRDWAAELFAEEQTEAQRARQESIKYTGCYSNTGYTGYDGL